MVKMILFSQSLVLFHEGKKISRTTISSKGMEFVGIFLKGFIGATSEDLLIMLLKGQLGQQVRNF